MIPTIPVVCAVIRKQNRYLACQRSELMREPLRWEFPGGKIESGESLFAALHRELHEELAIAISVRGILRASTWKQNNKVIQLYPLLCLLVGDDFELKEHKAFRWVTLEEFGQLDWCDADVEILDILRNSGLEETGWWKS
ncbi:MAG: (deoxy)nucleoside triphosphate pyrophosphohydrolase [Chitinophagaceae bacterium]|nr:(deoxy)nucleoside triphosphate pyrophosphohydrolase [Oligoflexus sp.]